MKTLYSLILAASLSTSLFAQEDGPGNNWTELNLAVTDHQVIPSYQAFALAAGQLEIVAGEFCNSPDTAGLESFRQAFHGAMDGWQQIQHVQFGPITYFNWNFRLHYWPDEKGTGGRQLESLVTSGNAELLEPDNFARESVGVQGFPALERLLFTEGSIGALQEDPFRCQVAHAIARNISDIAEGVHQRWVDEFRATIANADERGFFESAEDAAIDFMKAQVEPIRRIQQQKIEEVIGENAQRARVRRAESWRAERSLRNVELNILALESFFNGDDQTSKSLSSLLEASDVSTINGIFSELEQSFMALPDSLEEALASDGGHARLLALAAHLDALFEAFEAGLKNTDLYLGFNSLDGD